MSGTMCATQGCHHFKDLHDIGGVCSFPDCKCTDFKPMSSVKQADKGLGSWLGRHLGGKKGKSGREQLESQ